MKQQQEPLQNTTYVELQQQKEYNMGLHRRLRITLAVLTVVICSFNIHDITTNKLRHSRNIHRTFNQFLLLHDDLDIYWFGYRAGQYLINYPIHQYYMLDEFSQFLQRIEDVLGRLQGYTFGYVDQQELNTTTQKIYMQYFDHSYQQYNWTIGEGLIQPFNSSDISGIKYQLIQCNTMRIMIYDMKLYEKEIQIETGQQSFRWDLNIIIQPFSRTSIFVTLVIHQKMSLGFQHIPHFILGICTLALILHDLIKRQKIRKRKATQRINYLTYYTYRYILYKFKPQDTPDFLMAFFLLYTSLVSFTHMFTLRYILILDGVTCFISWLFILKLYTQNDDYHISFLIKKSYILVGRLFVSFGPMFIGFCLFALTAFCRYTNLFQDFHKSFISIFCVCYYNMTYEQFRTTQRSNPISTIFFTSLVMIFTVCIYSGMLVSVFCSFMWNKREQKNKQQLLKSLKIQCKHCTHKYEYQQGYKTSLTMSMRKKLSEYYFQQEDDPHAHTKYRHAVIERQDFLSRHIISMLQNNWEIVLDFMREQNQFEIQQQYSHILQRQVQQVENIIKSLSSEYSVKVK